MIDGRARRIALGTLAGAALVVTGTMLPWLTLFAGLQRFNGLAGRNGQLVLGSAAVAVVLTILGLVRPRRALRLSIAAVGAMLAGFSTWLIYGLLVMVHREASNPMLMARSGPGLFVVATGAVLIAVAPLFAERPARARVPAR
jgi:uncharacterized protein with PQ loop repeat